MPLRRYTNSSSQRLSWAILSILWITIASFPLRSFAEGANGTAACIQQRVEQSFAFRGYSPPERALPSDGVYIADSNVLRAIVKNRDHLPDAEQIGYQNILRTLERKTGLSRERILNSETQHSYLWVTRQVAHEYGEWTFATAPPQGISQTKTLVAYESSEFRQLVKVLEGANVGGPKGESDRVIVAEAFFAQTASGGVPTFVTLDRGIYNKLCRLSPKCESAMKQGPPFVTFPDGFLVQIDLPNASPRTLRVIAVPTK